MPALYQREKTTPLTRDDLILERLKDLKDGQREINARMDKLDARMDRLEDNFNARMNKLENEVRGSSRHTQIMTATVVGIALAVIYFVFTH
ncbi:MAG: hypothetical protein IJ774_08140 [Selenomonadaceae bacterium]|nr:hypothetical protein [Selenomonadaceae bacterium]